AVSVVVLGNGDVPMNVNRWRKQVGLNSLPPSETYDSTTQEPVGGLPAYRIDLRGPGNKVAKPGGMSMPLGEEAGPGLNYRLPEGWSKSSENAPMAAVTFRAGKKEECLVTVSPMTPPEESKRSFLLMNVNRWRGQVSKPAFKVEDEALKAATGTV